MTKTALMAVVCLCTIPVLLSTAAEAADTPSTGFAPVPGDPFFPSWRWSELGQRPGPQPVPLETNDAVYALTTFDGDLIAGGDFTQAGAVVANYIARWDGSDWHALGSGMDGPVYALTVFNGNLIAGGAFTTAGGTPSNYVAEWDGASWSVLDVEEPNDEVHTLAVYAGSLVAGGKFTQVGASDFHRIAAFDGASWDTLGTGLNDWVVALKVYSGSLIAGGWFTEAGGVPANYIARWDGASWSALGAGMNWGVYALEYHAGPDPSPSPLHSGSTSRSGMYEARTPSGSVLQEHLVAGGLFTTADGNWSPGIAAWDGGSWSPVGPTGMNHGVYGLAVYRGDLIAGGSFTMADTVSANRIASWDGFDWAPLGNGMDNGVWVVDLYTPPLSPSADLIAGGEFVQAGDTLARHIAKWDGIEWEPLGELDVSGIGSEGQEKMVQISIVAQPNPFTDRVELMIQGLSQPTELKIFDVTGRVVKSFELNPPAGQKSHVIWDGTDEHSKRVAPGLYFAMVAGGARRSTGRVIRLR
jgi:hypothetical protein